MKKLIAIAVVFALVMGGVFAETSVSGGANGTVVLASGKTDQDDIYDDARFAVGLFPNYKLGDLKAGLGFDVLIRNIGMADYNDLGAIVYWQASPQVQYTVGAGTLKTGLAIGSIEPDATPLGKIQWKIPVRLSFSL